MTRLVPNTATPAELEAERRNGHRPSIHVVADVEEEPERKAAEPTLYGPLGRAAEAVAKVGGLYAPALYGNLLGQLGPALGFGPLVELGAAIHRANVWTATVAPSGGGKGDSTSAVAAVVAAIDPKLAVSTGIGSGPALVDEFYEEVPDPEGGKRVVFALVSDRRLLLRYDEMSDLLAAIGSNGSHRLSENLRAAWDGIQIDARARTVGKRSVPAGEHVVGLVAGVTVADLTEGMTARQLRNGMGGRVVWVPQPAMALRRPVTTAAIVAAAGRELTEAVRRAKGVGRIDYTDEANDWISATHVEAMAKVAGDPTAEALTARWPANTLRAGIGLTALDGATKFDLVRAQAAGGFTLPCLEHAIELFGVGGEVATGRRAMAAESAPAGTSAAVSSDADQMLAKWVVGEFVTENELKHRFGSGKRSTMDFGDALAKLEQRGYAKSGVGQRGTERSVERPGWWRLK